MMSNITVQDPDSNESSVALLGTVNHQFAMTILPATIVMGIESVVGFVGNILIIIVYSKQYDRSNFRHFVLFLAFNDLTSCVTCIPAEVFTQLNWYRLTYSWLCKTKVYFNLLTSWNSASILLLFSFDRFRKIMFPLKMQIRPSLAFKLCVCLTMISAIVVGPSTMGWASQTYPLPTDFGPVNVTVCGKSDELPDKVYAFLLYFYILSILLMMILITTFNMVTAKKILCGKRLLPSSTGARIDLHSSTRDSSTDANTVTEYLSSLDDNTNGPSETASGGDTALHDPKYQKDRRESKGHNNEAYQHDSHYNEDQNASSVQQNKQTSKVRRQHSSLGPSPSTSTVQADVVKNARLENGRRTQKLVIMFVLTMVFVITMTMYMIVTLLITPKLSNNSLSSSEKVLFFIAWRMYFVNYMVNPFLYGFMDQRFRSGLRYHLCGR